MTTNEIVTQIQKKKSFLCIGLDVDLAKIPTHLLAKEDPIFEFNKAIIDATHDLCVSYKPNMAFYEAYGLKGWQSLEKTITYINEKYPEIFTIADAKRGDIGNTSSMYAWNSKEYAIENKQLAHQRQFSFYRCQIILNTTISQYILFI